MKIRALPPAEMEGWMRGWDENLPPPADWMQGWDEQLHCDEKHMLLISNMILG